MFPGLCVSIFNSFFFFFLLDISGHGCTSQALHSSYSENCFTSLSWEYSRCHKLFFKSALSTGEHISSLSLQEKSTILSWLLVGASGGVLLFYLPLKSQQIYSLIFSFVNPKSSPAWTPALLWGPANPTAVQQAGDAAGLRGRGAGKLPTESCTHTSSSYSHGFASSHASYMLCWAHTVPIIS